jgi:hypothetical protein
MQRAAYARRQACPLFLKRLLEETAPISHLLRDIRVFMKANGTREESIMAYKVLFQHIN